MVNIAAATKQCLSRLLDSEVSFKCGISSTSSSSTTLSYFSRSLYSNNIRFPPNQKYQLCVMSMNACQGDPQILHNLVPLGTIETRTFPIVLSHALALERLRSAISELKSNSPPHFTTPGIIRLQVPMKQRIDAIDGLQAQDLLLPRCFFSGRIHTQGCNTFLDITTGNGPNHRAYRTLVSVAGVGSVFFFKQHHPFSYTDRKSIKRFLSRECPLIRAYGAIQMQNQTCHPNGEAFSSFYFMVPQIPNNRLSLTSLNMLAASIACDDALSWPWQKAINELQAIICQISSTVLKLCKEAPRTFILSNNNIPSKKNWDLAANQALQKVSRSDSELTKVDGQNAYQFCLQPHDAPAFIGNPPEQLFRRKWLNIESDTMAGTCTRGESMTADLQIELDLLTSPKYHLEFSIVRESIRKKLEDVCNFVVVEPKKAIRKLLRVQHLYAKLAGRLRSEGDEFEILSSLHPTPAVCGFPTDETFDRGMYAGPVGWFGGGESEFAVVIRSALVEKGAGALIYAGTGIVEGSEASLEWDELELKVSQYSKLLKLEIPPRKKVKDC